MKYITLIALALVQTACGGGGASSQPVGSENVGCSQEYYQTMFGKYSGTLVLNTMGDPARVCEWTSTVEIAGESVLTRCLMRATTSGAVVQSTFYPDDIRIRYQCIDDAAERTVREPIGDTFPVSELPGLDNSNFPVDIQFSTEGGADRGPYFGDESVNTAYVNLYDGATSELVQQITVNGDGTITMRDTAGILLGTLVKE